MSRNEVQKTFYRELSSLRAGPKYNLFQTLSAKSNWISFHKNNTKLRDHFQWYPFVSCNHFARQNVEVVTLEFRGSIEKQSVQFGGRRGEGLLRIRWILSINWI